VPSLPVQGSTAAGREHSVVDVLDAAGASAVNATCQKEMAALKANSARAAQAEACDKKLDRTSSVLAALQEANISEAQALASAAFSECAGLSQGCALEVAGWTVLHLRLSGRTVSKDCFQLAEFTAGQASPLPYVQVGPCHLNVTTEVKKALSDRDLPQAIAAAQWGLDRCAQIESPCDFQIAPLMAACGGLLRCAAGLAHGHREQHEAELLRARMLGKRIRNALVNPADPEQEEQVIWKERVLSLRQAPGVKAAEPTRTPPTAAALPAKLSLLNLALRLPHATGTEGSAAAAK